MTCVSGPPILVVFICYLENATACCFELMIIGRWFGLNCAASASLCRNALGSWAVWMIIFLNFLSNSGTSHITFLIRILFLVIIEVLTSAERIDLLRRRTSFMYHVIIALISSLLTSSLLHGYVVCIQTLSSIGTENSFVESQVWVHWSVFLPTWSSAIISHVEALTIYSSYEAISCFLSHCDATYSWMYVTPLDSHKVIIKNRSTVYLTVPDHMKSSMRFPILCKYIRAIVVKSRAITLQTIILSCMMSSNFYTTGSRSLTVYSSNCLILNLWVHIAYHLLINSIIL